LTSSDGKTFGCLASAPESEAPPCHLELRPARDATFGQVNDVLASIRAESSDARLAACVEAFVRRALAEPVRAYALIAEPVDPAVERERLAFRRAYADIFASILRGRALDTELAAAAIVGALAEALVGPLSRRDRDPTALVANLQSFVLSAVREPSRVA
jgi:hypothetical protein